METTVRRLEGDINRAGVFATIFFLATADLLNSDRVIEAVAVLLHVSTAIRTT